MTTPLQILKAAKSKILTEARRHADACLDAKGGWDFETLSENVIGSFWQELDISDCESVASDALVARYGI